MGQNGKMRMAHRFQDTIGLLLFGQVGNDWLDRADDQIKRPSTSSGKSSEPSARISTSMPFNSRRPVRPLFSRSISALCADNPGSIETPGHRQPAGMIGDGEIPKSATPGRIRHLFQTMPTVRRGRMGMQIPTRSCNSSRGRKPPFIRRLELAAVLS